MKIFNLFAIVALSLGFTSALQLADDPPAYFGGLNNGAYLDWLITNNIETKYNSSVYMPSVDPGMGAAVHWSVDEEYFHVAVAARASGWVGFGLSDVGGMLGSDFALFSVNRPSEIVDAHAVETYYPKEDDCQRDWVYVNSSSGTSAVAVQRQDSLPEAVTAEESEEFIMFEARRKLVTGDPQDAPIVRDNLIEIAEQRIIAAWGDSPDVSFHGSSVARGSIRVYKDEVETPDFDALMAKDSSGSFFVGAREFEIPNNETTYEDFCITRADIIAMGVPNTTDLMSLIGFKPILDEGPSAAYVHHYVVTGSFDASDDACERPSFDMVYVWAPGDGGFALPDFLGAPLFGEDGFQSFTVEIHYDNPRFNTGVIDSSGVEVFYSTTPRPVEMGVLQVGDPFVTLFGQPVGTGLSGHHFECPGTCSDMFLSDGEPITVVREYLHMHIAGERTTNEHIRNGTVIRTASTEVWEFDQNGNVPVRQQPYEVYPGDSFRMSCYYRGNEDSVFGLGSREEMCMAFLYYYPRKSIKVETEEGDFNIPFTCGFNIDWFNNSCNAAYEPQGVIESDEGLHRLFGKQPEECLTATDASAENPAIVLEPPAEVPAPAPVEGVAVQTETETASSAPNPVPVPADVVPAPSPSDAISGAASVGSGVALSVALFVAGLL